MSLLTPAIDVGNNIWVYAGIIMFSNIYGFLVSMEHLLYFQSYL